MRVLRRVQPTPEQINIIRRIQSGASLIRGAAGSGKTTTALLALRASTGAAVNQLRIDGHLPANVLVLAYTKSLRSYISTVAEEEMQDYAQDVQLFASTFDKWALDTLGLTRVEGVADAATKLRSLARNFPRDTNFVIDEVEYLLGRFLPDQLDDYIAAERTGRGNSPTMPATLRQQLLSEVVRPYQEWKKNTGAFDFNDLATAMAEKIPTFRYDVIVVDEAQDLSSNQLRAVVQHAAVDATIAIVTDTNQRIYPRGASLREAGISIAQGRSFRLSANYRNTRQIASLAASIATGLAVDDDGTLPNAAACKRDGPLPELILGTFPEQLQFVLNRLASIDLTRETVGFLHLKGGGWFDRLRSDLSAAGYDFCELQGAAVWPDDDVNIGLSTFHSAKGLEFDHVFMIGLARVHAAYGDEPDDDRFNAHRRLVAMGVGRARQTVLLGAKVGEELPLLDAIDRTVIREIVL